MTLQYYLELVSVGCVLDFTRARGVPRSRALRAALWQKRMLRLARQVTADATVQLIGTPLDAASTRARQGIPR